MKSFLYCIAFLVLLISCKSQAQKITIDKRIETTFDSLLATPEVQRTKFGDKYFFDFRDRTYGILIVEKNWLNDSLKTTPARPNLIRFEAKYFLDTLVLHKDFGSWGSEGYDIELYGGNIKGIFGFRYEPTEDEKKDGRPHPPVIPLVITNAVFNQRPQRGQKTPLKGVLFFHTNNTYVYYQATGKEISTRFQGRLYLYHYDSNESIR